MPDNFNIELEQEVDGRWIAEIQELPGALVYGATQSEASLRAEKLAMWILADRLTYAEKD